MESILFNNSGMDFRSISGIITNASLPVILLPKTSSVEVPVRVVSISISESILRLKISTSLLL